MDERSIGFISRVRAPFALTLLAILFSSLSFPRPCESQTGTSQSGTSREERRLIRTRKIENRVIRELSLGSGWIEVTPQDTLARHYEARGLEAFRLDLEAARDFRVATNANRWKIHLTIATQLKAEWRDEQGNRHTAITSMDSSESRRCLRAFQTFSDLVSTYTRGLIAIDSRVNTVKIPISKVHRAQREGQYWIPPHNIVDLSEIRAYRPDSVFLYCRPGDIPIPKSLLGATHGSNNGILGAGISTIHIPDGFFNTREQLPDNIVTLLTLREFYHQIHYAARALMGYNSLPSLRSAPEIGYRAGDLELPLWTAALRDLMRTTYPPSFWRSAHMGIIRDVDRSPAPWIENRLCDYDSVFDEWPTQLPNLGSIELELITGVGGITPRIGQFEPGNPCYLFFELPDALYREGVLVQPALGDSSFNNFLSLDPRTGLESMAVVRIPGKFDLVAVRMDVAEPILRGIRTELGRNASRCILGYITAPDPNEGQPISFLVAKVDFGETLPKTELEAMTRGLALEPAEAPDDEETDDPGEDS